MIDMTRWVSPVQLGERRFLHPGPLRWLRALGWAVALVFLVALASLSTAEGLGHLVPKTSGPLQLAANIIAVVVGLGAYAVAVRLAEGRWPSEIALKPLLPQLGAGLLIGAAMFAAVMAIMAGFGLYDIRGLGAAPAWISLGKAAQSGVVAAGCAALAWTAAPPNWPPLPSLASHAAFWACVLYLVLACTLFAFFAQNHAVRRSSPTRVALLMGSEPAFGALFACLWLGERISAAAWAGGALIVAASLLATVVRRSPRAARRRSGAIESIYM